jgi:hypothetical protein
VFVSPEKALRVVLAALIAAAGLRAQTTTPHPAAARPPANPAFFPLDQVRRGMHGVAYTVFEGTAPEPMDVEILGVLKNAIGPNQDMILARLTSPKPEYTGVVAGMSGSPVYIDGKLLGALSYRIGQFSKEPIAGITPIRQMLEVRDQKDLPRPDAAPTPIPTADPASAATGPRPQLSAGATPAALAQDSSLVRPIETPLVFNGFSPAAIKLWQDHLSVAGMSAVAGLGGSASSQPQPEPIVPGSAVSAILVRGDLEIAATCTVTYVDPKQLLACGHPITQFGPVSMPMTKAEVVATLPSPLNAFKIVNTTETVGAFNEDRQSAIRGQFGQPARMIPVSVRINNAASPRTLHFEVIDQPQITPGALMVSVYQSLMGSNNYSEESSYRMRGQVKLAGYSPVNMEALLAPSEMGSASISAALLVGDHFTRLYNNAARRTPIESLNLTFDTLPERRSMQIESARSSASVAQAGDTVTIDATVRPYHGEPRNLRIPIKLPTTIQPGTLRILVSDAATLDRLTQQPRFGAQPLDLASTITQLNALHANDRLYVTLLEPEAQAVLDGRTLAALPLSMANVLEPLRTNQEMALSGESAVTLASLPVEAQLEGQQILTVRVE